MTGLLLGDVGSYILLCCFIVVCRHMFGGVCHELWTNQHGIDSQTHDHCQNERPMKLCDNHFVKLRNNMDNITLRFNSKYT